ncbi:MAG: MFS transporter [Dehalococcoidia bacterium]|nr:MFS transporter [Dehalococcoidia bacterium]
MNTVRLPGGIHFAWAIVVILALVQIIGNSIGMAVGVVVIPLSDPEGDFGWSMVTIGAALMMYYLVGAMIAPMTGWLGDQYGARKMLLLGSLLFGGSMIFVGTISQPWQFFLTFGFLLALTQSICIVPMMATVSGWFRRRLGVGVGILWAAGGVGTAVLAPLMGYLIANIGWQATFWVFGAAGGAILLLLTLVLRNRPADVGLKPYGTSPSDPPEAVMSKALEKLRIKAFNQHMRRTRAFWNLPIIHGLGCAGHGIVLIYATYIAYDRGVSYVAALLILSIISICSIASRFVTPVLAERFGGKPVMATALFLQGITVLVLFWAQDIWMFYLFAMVFGVGFGGEMSAYLVVNRQYFGSGPIATCYGFQTMGALTGHATATGLAGLVLYVTNSYSAILALSMLFSFGGVLVIMTLESTSRVLIPDWEKSLPAEARSAGAVPNVLVPHFDE